VRGVIFDVDGTLAVSNEVQVRSWVEALAEAGYEADEIRMIEQEEMLRPDLVMSDVAVFSGHGDHHCQWIPGDLDEELERISGSQSGGKLAALPGMLRRSKA